MKEPVPWGPLGYVTFKRTYSRLREDLGRTEEFGDMLERGVNALLDYGMRATNDEVQTLYEYMYSLKCGFAGRMCWQLGTSTVARIGGNSLCNCYYISVNDLESFCFTFDMLMLGGGVGFGISPSDVFTLPKVLGPVKVTRRDGSDVDFIVPDNREGWVELLRRVLHAYFITGRSFSYSTHCVRGKGERIKGFGGVASGPGELVKGIGQICGVLDGRVGKKIRPIDALDMMNIIGSVVVSGNVRRSAQIAVGSPKDIDYIEAKMWSNGTIPNWRGNSNNTVRADSMCELPSRFWDGYIPGDDGVSKGEPYGLFNLELSRNYGRLADGRGYRPDLKAEGTNPCVPGETLILTRDGDVRIDSVVGQRVEVWNGEEWSAVTPAVTGRNQEIVRVELDDGRSLECTVGHKWVIELDDGSEGFTPACLLMRGQDIISYPPYPGGEKKKCKVVGTTCITFVDKVYCFTEPIKHRGTFNGIVTGQCAEQTLEDGECCDLAEQYLPRLRDRQEFVTSSRLMYKVCKTVLQLPFSWAKTQEVVSRNQRMGVGVSGFCQAPHFKADDYTAAYRAMEDLDATYSREIGAERSIKLSTVKPSGTVSLLPGVTPGVHPAYSRYYIRRIRFSADDPIIEKCRKSNYHVEPKLEFDGTPDHSTQIVSFPIDVGPNTLTASQVSAVDQMDMQKFLQTYWSDNAVSVTVYYRDEELPAMQEKMRSEYKDSIKTISVLRHSNHGFQQAPYEEITASQYREMAAVTKPITSLDDAQQWDIVDSLECAGGVCPVK